MDPTHLQDLSTSGSTEVVYNTAELLESILHNLPTKDLLLAQRVCRQWKQAIERSPKLQRALFFLPVEIDLLTLQKDGMLITGFLRFEC